MTARLTGSRKRKKVHRALCTEEEFAGIEERAAAVGRSVSDFLRRLGLGLEGPPRKKTE